MGTRFRRATCASTAVALLTLAGSLAAADPAAAAATRIRLGSASDVSRTTWQGPAFTMNGDGKIIASSMTAAIDAIRGGTGSLDVVVIAGSAPGSGSPTPECDASMALPGVNSCTSWTLTAASDGNNSQVNTDVRNAEFVYFAGGDQCRYAAWKGSALEASVESVVAKGGGSGGGSAGHHINSPVVYDACKGSITSAEALANPYDSYATFTTGMFEWENYGGVINDSHFRARDRMGRTMAFVARAIKDGRTSGGKAWGVGVEEGGSLLLDKNGRATLYGKEAYVVLGDHQPEQASAGKPLTFSDYKIWRLGPGQTYDFKNRPTCGYYLRSITNGIADANLYTGSPQNTCGTPGGTSALAETEANDTRTTANDATALAYPASLTGSMKSATDRDYFRVAFAAGERVDIHCAIPDGAYDADLYLLDSGGSTIDRSVNDGVGTDESLTFTRTAAGSGTYYVELDAYQGSGSSPYTCTLTKT
ncbi:pre-peptidase C-terminal domain-containing protein [Streptomyces antarcticus]|uniref:pre-peptidase C-terminal domain-containing protein n=1 Tax=Streptomyces antarcticus TaxID=2996458 RepID=UPI00226F8C01|nr:MULTISPECIES: pre-peptidase C-terminal domain-containing protein [unclassified Streptomyces]MCY0939870.1 pre-peptidase C-terminal domain-containing protein [Streptomyces sp. H34-AA3]MCZ4081040.1 pre-peptidase C-terminal domain-containing protein [Streptomyces sp. H34-S5]